MSWPRTPLAIVAVAVALAFVPRLGLPAFYDSLLYLVLHWIVLATSWNILSGTTGYFSFGHGAPHGWGRFGHGITAQIDDGVVHTLVLSRE